MGIKPSNYTEERYFWAFYRKTNVRLVRTLGEINLNHCSGIIDSSGEMRENGQYVVKHKDRRCLQTSLQTALDSWKQE